jgi:hypothetical protein
LAADGRALLFGDEHVAGERGADTSFMLARVFAADGASVAAYVRERQQSRSARPT